MVLTLMMQLQELGSALLAMIPLQFELLGQLERLLPPQSPHRAAHGGVGKDAAASSLTDLGP